MKRIYGYIGDILLMTILVLGMAACSPDGFTSPNEAGIPIASDYADAIRIEVNQETNYVAFSFSGEGVIPVWIIDGKDYSTSFNMTRYYRKSGEYNVEIKIANANGMSDGTVTRTFQIDKTIMDGFGGFAYESAYNIWRSATISAPTFWYAPGWSQIADPEYTVSDGIYTLTFPEATTDTWQAQMALNTNIATEAARNYDFSVIFTSTINHPHVMVKLVDKTDDNIYFFAQTIALTANEPVCFWKYDMPGIDIAGVNLVLDFGGNAAGSVINIEDIVLKDHANDDGTVVPEEELVSDPTWNAVDSADNLWYGVPFTNTFYYAQTSSWIQLPDPVLVTSGTEYTVTFPEETHLQWQNQVSFITNCLTTSAAENYDFRVSVTASNDIENITVKLTQNDDNETYLFVLNKNLLSGEEMIVKSINAAGVNMSQAKLVFDFGGNPANTTVIIKDIILQIHKD